MQDKGYTVEIIWEKDWQALINQRPEIKVYLQQHRTYTHFKKYLNQNQIIQYIQDGHLFGFVECDIEVPDHLKDYFSEMTPIFKNTEVSLKDVGQHMQEYAKEHKIKDIPRRLLIGSYFGKKIGLSTPLLKWYLNHGLVISHIYTVVEYIPNAALNSFMTQVAQARLDGDRDNDKALIAETIKLIGNSSYGKLITNKVEFKGNKMIGLCSKSYCTELFATENSPAQVKFSMKGVNKGQFKNPMPHYEHVLNTKQNFRACNQGIRAKDESMVTYKQDKNALTYFYPKRKVLADGRTTVPLDI